MAASYGRMKCKLFPSAFSGEVVFQINTTAGKSYEGVAPKHYAESSTQPAKAGVDGMIKVRVLSNGGKKARVSVPDGQILDVSAESINEQ